MLHTTKYGERKLVVYMLTRDHGRCNYITSVTKSSSRVLFQPLYLLEFMGIASGSEGLHNMREAVLNPPLRSFAQSPAKAMIVMMLSELLYRVVKESDEHIYDFVREEIIALDMTSNDTAIANFHLHFMVHLAAYMGYAPGGEYAVGCFFDIKEGVFTKTEPRHTLYLLPHLAEILHLMMITPLSELHTLKLNGAVRREFLDSMVDYYGYHNDAIFNVRSISMLAEIFA